VAVRVENQVGSKNPVPPLHDFIVGLSLLQFSIPGSKDPVLQIRGAVSRKKLYKGCRFAGDLFLMSLPRALSYRTALHALYLVA